MEAMIAWARGPLFRFAVLIMVLGLARHLALTVFGLVRAIHKSGDRDIPYAKLIRKNLSWLCPVVILRERFLFCLTSVLFHIGLILVPIFYAGHILLWERSLGLSWPSLPRTIADVLTVTTCCTAYLLFFSRVLDPMMRSLSRFQDYILLPLLSLPFITGFLASHPALSPFSYDSVMLTHIVSGNLIMVLVPFTKMSHVILLSGTQLVSEVAWHFPADTGERVAQALHKEEQPL
ncbi:hypothetical protein JXQ70_07090 [bacterium]|nr:hypothetical protein [bacterium]